jgi:hypothetical protein
LFLNAGWTAAAGVPFTSSDAMHARVKSGGETCKRTVMLLRQMGQEIVASV